MAQFQTWFGNAPYLAYGIQLLPLTPIAEERDNVEWAKQLYTSYSESCQSTPDCDENGWGVLLGSILATIGHREKAIDYAQSLSSDVFETAGGNGHSLTNTIWYYATRPKIDEPYTLPKTSSSTSNQVATHLSKKKTASTQKLDCGCSTCTSEVLNLLAGDYTCGERIKWLIKSFNKTSHDACSKVSGVEFTDVCAGCDPNRCVEPSISPLHEKLRCPKCNKDICRDKKLNRCPINHSPFLCVNGVNKGGCSDVPWVVDANTCTECCELPNHDCTEF